MQDHVTDSRGNRCDVSYFGSLEAAQVALDSLEKCRNCRNCRNCSRCSDCSDCSRCWDCSHVAYLYDRTYLKGDPLSEGVPGAPPVPVIPDIHKVIYEAARQEGALDMSAWHSPCGTAHCRGGWVVVKAGEAGRALERFYNTALAAQLIYQASGYDINPCLLYGDNEAAMADMKRLAETEAQG